MAADELVDCVDEHNQVLQTVTRAQMREQKLPHRASYIVVQDRQGRFAIEVRTLNKDYAPGKLDACVGGVMQHGEDPVAAALRELEEEIGIRLEEGKSFVALGTQKIMWRDGIHFLYGYLYFAQCDAITIRQPSEVSALLWLSYDELLKIKDNCVPDSLQAFVEILARFKNLTHIL